MNTFSNRVIKWHGESGRTDLPWQINKTPYKVWISEVMLQQTQVNTAMPYFNAFMKRFPNIDSLAESTTDDVLSYWSGLGYYARGRNIHKTACILKDDYSSSLPCSLIELESLPGIGRSTAGAIYSLGFNKSAPILDGNVKRVLSRHKRVDGILKKPLPLINSGKYLKNYFRIKIMERTLKALWILALLYAPEAILAAQCVRLKKTVLLEFIVKQRCCRIEELQKRKKKKKFFGLYLKIKQ